MMPQPPRLLALFFKRRGGCLFRGFLPQLLLEKTMKAMCLLTSTPATTGESAGNLAVTMPELVPVGRLPGETVQQTIHLLHTLRYSETVLWSPMVRVEEPVGWYRSAVLEESVDL